MQELNQLIQIIAQSENSTNQISETKGLLNILTKYTQSFILLNQYDSNAMELKNLEENITYEIDYNEVLIAISELKKN